MTHFLDIDTTDPAALRAMIDAARAMKAARAGLPRGTPDAERPLAGRIAALLFEKPSTRTRVSFDVGIRQMGGETMVLPAGELQLGQGEAVADTARVLSRYVDLIVLRCYAAATLHELADHADVPVVNGLTNASHPCQTMADILTYEEHRGPIAGAKAVWVGDGNNVCTSLIHAAGQFGFDVTFTGPEALDPPPGLLAWARARGVAATVERDPAAAVANADLVLTDTWVSMHDPAAERERRHAQLRPYQVTQPLMDRAKPGALFMHCLPAHRGEEATDAVLDGPSAVIFDEAENRLHAQKAILRRCLDL